MGVVGGFRNVDLSKGGSAKSLGSLLATYIDIVELDDFACGGLARSCILLATCDDAFLNGAARVGLSETQCSPTTGACMLSLAAGVSWASLSGARVALSASAILIDFSNSIYLSFGWDSE